MSATRFPKSPRRFFTGMGTITSIPTLAEIADEAECIELLLAEMEKPSGKDIWAKVLTRVNGA